MLAADLINNLDSQYPEFSPIPEDYMDERRMWMDFGKRELIRTLKYSMEEQKDGD